MTPAKYCKEQGTTLQHVSDMTGVSRETLRNWFYNKTRLFEIVVEGVIYRDNSV